MGLTSSTYPILFVLGIVPGLGSLVLSSIIKLILSNKRLSKFGVVTNAQILDKYRRGSKTYYKRDDGISYFVIAEWLVNDQRTGKQMICKSKFMVNGEQFASFEIGESRISLIYLPDDYLVHNLEMLSVHTIETRTIIKRVSIGLLLILLVPTMVSIFAEEWQLFVYPVLLGVMYFLIGTVVMRYCCRDRSCLKNTSFQTRNATSDDLDVFENMKGVVTERGMDPMSFENDKKPGDDKKVSLLDGGSVD